MKVICKCNTHVESELTLDVIYDVIESWQPIESNPNLLFNIINDEGRNNPYHEKRFEILEL